MRLTLPWRFSKTKFASVSAIEPSPVVDHRGRERLLSVKPDVQNGKLEIYIAKRPLYPQKQAVAGMVLDDCR